MDEKERQQAFMSALVTEHFVLQTGATATVSEAGTRASLYLVSLSSSLVAMGFASRERDVFVPFVATILPALFLWVGGVLYADRPPIDLQLHTTRVRLVVDQHNAACAGLW